MNLDNSSVECAEQIKNFEKLTGTNRDDWETSELKNNTVSIDAQGRKYYEFSDRDTKDYMEIEPFFDHLKKYNPQRLQQIKAQHEKNRSADDKSNGSWWYSCQYCGHGIIYPFKIKNIKLKLKMVIGSHCIKGFKNVDPYVELLRKRDEKTLRNAMKGWIKPICNDIWTNEKFAKRFYWKDGEKKFIPKQKFIDFAELLKGLDVDSLSFAELKKIFRITDKLEFVRLPVFVEEIIHPRSVKEKAKSTGLDEFFWS